MEVDASEGDKSKLENYQVMKQIEKGSFGSSFVVLHKTENKKYAMKRIRLAKQTEKFKQTAYHEMNLIAKLNNPYIVQCKDSWVDKDNNVYFVTAHCEGGNMAEAIRKARGKLFPEEKIFKWLTQLLLAVDYLHSNRVLHRDLKCSSIFLTEDEDIQLGDVGLAKLLHPEKPSSSVSATPNRLCPEVLENIPYGYKSDIWSLGCCIFEITAHQPSFKALDTAGLINKINRSIMSPLPIVYSSNLKQIIKAMLRKKPEHRPTAAKLLRNPCLQAYVLRCENPSPVYLPVFLIKPTNSPKDKARRKSLPGKLVNENDYRERGEVARSLENLYSFQSMAEAHSSSSSQSAKSVSMSSAEDKLETKRIDPTCCTLNIPKPTVHSSSDSLAEPEMAIYSAEKQDEHATVPKEAVMPFTEDSQLLHEIDVKVVSTKDEPLCPQQAIEETEVEGTEPRNPPISSTAPSSDASLADVTSNLTEKTSLEKSTEVDTTAESLSGSIHTDKDRTSGKPDTGIDASSMEVKDEDAKAINLTASDMSLLSKLTKLGIDGSLNHERANALESLLELCARLLKQEKYDDLAGVLRPFGEEAVSSRETAIWLTKSLLSVHNFNEGT
ncbi:PREDICTED: serine/threonine-protein kinase Nek7 [Tarenaya hassleriana]|uniref:serine/threonine-protein kinase Nek7 n=1 Tax=Tarenaya hassleriana TaxID=28532 RepID=UPI00053C4C6E|nr:PREDICTED: serine/threonine-protein kinase Nek7 [Tarenaya hassleriana]XP_010547366.1 PREDICTED: serine/threonine-protein kinase Nek7 [Tarenaya hassleriana]